MAGAAGEVRGAAALACGRLEIEGCEDARVIERCAGRTVGDVVG